LTEMLGTELVAGEKLRLVSGEDIANTKVDLALADAESLSPNTLARLHKNLDSDLIVLGSYTAVGSKGDTRIRLDLRLQDTVAGATIADVTAVGNETDLFDLVSQVGSRLREKLGVEAVSDVEVVSVRDYLSSNREGARLYSEGLSRLRVFDALAARDLLQRAVTADPKYPLAHSALAEAYSRLGYDRKAQQEARQAFDLAANLSREEKLVVEGHYREVGHQYQEAVAVYRSLFALFPDNLDYGLKLAKVQVRNSEGHDALATVESLRKLATPASDDPRIELQEADAWDALSVYFSYLQDNQQWGELFVRTSVPPQALAQTIGQQIASLGHEYALQSKTIQQTTSQILTQERVTALLSAFFAALALLLASIGLYGLMSYAVTRRTREIGIRVALGAQRENVLWIVLRETLALAMIGLAIGIPCAIAVCRLISSMLFGLSSSDLPTIAAVSSLLLLVALFAGYLPACRACAIDPIVA
jgi:tetratricopeptide (TPR) repeat protein